MALRRIEDALAKMNRRTTANLNLMRPMRVEERFTDGTMGFRRMDGECVERGNECSSYVGELIEIPCGKPMAITGAAGAPMLSNRRAVNRLWVESLTPSVLVPGTSQTIVVAGRGFMAITRIEFGLPGTQTINPGTSVTAIHYTSPTQIEVDVTTSADAELLDLTSAPIFFDNPGVPL